ncbi:MAG: DNA polymerase III subunit delta [Thermoguttaceae bacterium]
MAKVLPAVDYLDSPADHSLCPVNVVFGDDAFLKRHVLSNLKRQALGGGDADFSWSVFDGKTAQLAEVVDELSTIAMFGGALRLVLVENADDLITNHRASLEDYVDSPRPTGRLILEAKTFPSNTRLYKAVAAKGLSINCSALKAGEIPRWMSRWAEKVHQVELATAAATLLVDLVGPELGLLDQEVGRLALLAGDSRKITAKTVSENVGSWRARKTWDMLDAALAGDVKSALTQLDRLLRAGEDPLAIHAQISANLRRFGAATGIVLSGESQRRRVGVQEALKQAGVPPFVLGKSESQLRHLGRERAGRLYQWLVETDLALKGNSALSPRLVIENLIIRLSIPTRLATGPAIR